MKKKLVAVTEELDDLKIKCGKIDVSFKNYAASSKTVESLFENQLKFKDNQNKGLGYDCVPPPFNHNYNPPLETNEEEMYAQYGQTSASASVKTEQSGPTEDVEMNDTNDSTSCAGKVVEDENKEKTIKQSNDSSNSESVASNSVTPNKPAVEKYRPPNQVKQPTCCKCACGNNQKQGKDMLPGAGRNNSTVKKKTCFHSGTPGHIARNCPNRAYIPYYAQGW